MLAIAGKDAQFGLHAFLAKHDVSKADKIKTIDALTQYAIKTAPKLVAKAAGSKLAPCMVILAKMAFEEYVRSAGSTGECVKCKGKGMLYNRKQVVKHPGIISKEGVVITELDIRQSELQGVPVFRDCPRCCGRGYKRMPSSVAYNAIKYLIPGLTQPSWSRNRKPFYESLAVWCISVAAQAEGLLG